MKREVNLQTLAVVLVGAFSGQALALATQSNPNWRSFGIFVLYSLVGVTMVIIASKKIR